MHHLGKLSFRNVSFEHREESEQALSNLNSEKLPSNFSQALKTIKKIIDEWGNNKDKIVKFLLDKVEIIRTEVPEGTDLNHYFEIMNTRGEQLEKHEILKARLMKVLPTPIEQSLFAKIWDSCSDMSRYVVMGFDSELREVILGGDWRKARGFFKTILNENSGKPENPREPKNSIVELINAEVKIEKKEQSQDKYDGEFTSVIDFPNFLMHVLRIYLEMFDKCKYSTQNDPCNVSLDEKLLLKSFEGKFEEKPKKVRIFIYTLLVCRYLFDLYVIKSNMIRTDYENWSLWKIVKRKSSYYYKNVFGDDGLDKNDDEALNDADPTKKALMLLSMFHVSNPSRIYKNWLYAVLRWLFKNKDNITPDNYVDFLEDLCDKFYFGNNCQEKDITDIILGKEKIDFSSNNKKWNDGVLVPNFVFNRLDYQLWKLFQEQEQEQKVEILSENDKWLTIKNKEAIWKKFRFTFRSSVEHHYPQHPSVGDELESGLNDFGNLYLLSQSKNSSLGNSSPEEKKKHYRNNEYDSLKQAIMMNYNEWSEREIEEHGKEMLEILNQSLSKANS